MRIGELCAGYGGLGMGVQAVLGGELAWVSEYEPPTKGNPKPSQGAAKILAYRFPNVPNLGDMTTVDWSAVEPVDVITGGTPCQDLSAAGKRAGMRAGTRSGLWASMCDAIDIIRPGLVVWENVRGALSAHADSAVEPCPICVGDERDVHLRALGRVVGDLSELGYDSRWAGLRAADVGAPHGRYRVFVVAWPATDAGHGAGNGAHERLGPGHVAAWARTGRDGLGAHEGATKESLHVATERDAVTQDSDLTARGERRLAAPGQAEGGGSRADARGRDRAPVADAGRIGSERRRGHGELAGPTRAGEGHEGQREWHGDAADDRGAVAWGKFAPAVHRWERVLERVAPPPTERGAKGQPRLSPAFVEWLMGLPAGWVTDVPGITRNEALKALGNGVVPAQAAAALRILLADQLQEAAA